MISMKSGCVKTSCFHSVRQLTDSYSRAQVLVIAFCNGVCMKECNAWFSKNLVTRSEKANSADTEIKSCLHMQLYFQFFLNDSKTGNVVSRFTSCILRHRADNRVVCLSLLISKLNLRIPLVIYVTLLHLFSFLTAIESSLVMLLGVNMSWIPQNVHTTTQYDCAFDDPFVMRM